MTSHTHHGKDRPGTPSLHIEATEGFAAWLHAENLSLAFTTYQTNRLFTVGGSETGRVQVHERLFDKPMGLYAKGSRLYLGTRYQIWRLDNLLAEGETRHGCDRLYLPKLAHTTGDLNVHDVVLDGDGEILFVNTDFSCLARLSPDYSFVPVWQPPFISKLKSEDRCHLNGLAMRAGQPAFVTACSATHTPAGWRDQRVQGGVVLDVASNEIVATGLSMPHSPRWYRERLWLLNSGTGELGAIDPQTGGFEPLCFSPGFVRGLAFRGHLALVGLSKLRSSTFSGLRLEERLAADGAEPECGLRVIDLDTGRIVHALRLEGCVEELFDVVVLPGVRRAEVLGFQSEDIERLVSFPGSGGLVTTKPTVHRPSAAEKPPVPGLPREQWVRFGNAESDTLPETASLPNPFPDEVPRYQRVFHLNPGSLIPYDSFTFPSLRTRFAAEPSRGELVGISSSIGGAMAGFAIAEHLPEHVAELISLWVAPEVRRQGIATRLLGHLEQALRSEGCTEIGLVNPPPGSEAEALEALLNRRGWDAPAVLGDGRRLRRKAWLPNAPLPTDRASGDGANDAEREAAQAHFRDGQQFAKAGDYRSAATCFGEALRLHPQHLAALNQMGNALQALGELDAAAAAYQDLLAIRPDVAEAHCNLGAVWQLQGEIERAAAAYRHALSLKPDLAAARRNLDLLKSIPT